jgi:hypothetical protein
VLVGLEAEEVVRPEVGAVVEEALREVEVGLLLAAVVGAAVEDFQEVVVGDLLLVEEEVHQGEVALGEDVVSLRLVPGVLACGVLAISVQDHSLHRWYLLA